MCRSDIPVEFLDHPQLLYKIEDNAATTDDGYQWFYEGRNGKKPFVFKANRKQLERPFPYSFECFVFFLFCINENTKSTYDEHSTLSF